MLEYSFFDRATAQRFDEQLRAHGLAPEWRDDIDDVVNLAIPHDQPDALIDEIERIYDGLFHQQAAVIARLDPDEVHRVGVQYSDADGAVKMVTLTPELANRLSPCLKPEQLQALVQTVADQVLAGGSRLCEHD